MSKKLTLGQAVKAKCKDCCYDPSDRGTWTQQVEGCTSTDCALWEHRPITGATKQKLKQERIAAMSEEERAAYEKRVNEQAKRLRAAVIP